MKNLLFLLVLVLAACAPQGESNIRAAQGTPTAGMAVLQETQVSTPTATLDPTPTIGYQSTAKAAQSTSQAAQATTDAANRLMVDATMQSNSLTATSDANAMMILGWTATAAPKATRDQMTAIPATMTRQAFADHVHGTDQAIAVTQTWNTLEAPVIAATMAQVAVDAKYAGMNNQAHIFFSFAIGIAFLALAFWLIRRGWSASSASRDAEATDGGMTPPRLVSDQQSVEAENYRKSQGVKITVQHVDESGFIALNTQTLPCTERQLTELAQRVLNMNESLAVNNFEGKGTLWTRETFYTMRNYMQTHHLVQSAGSGMVVLTEQGRAFLRAWIDHQTLPRGVEFSPEESEIPMSMSHTHENHTYENGGGGGLVGPLTVDDGR
jgi:hypothetical protein